MAADPLVSICIPTYNRAGMIRTAIESALAQTYGNIEVIVVDNASTDSTEEVVKGIHDGRLQYHRNPVNLGLFGNFNRCIELAHGEYIHILHSDDSIDPGFTGTCIRFFLDHPDVMMTFTSAKIPSGDHEVEISCSDKDEVFVAPEGFRRLLADRSFIICPSVMMKRSTCDCIGPYSLEYPYSSDFHQWLKVTREYNVGFIRSAWVYYRQGEHSESYHHLFTGVTGYLDTLKIYAALIKTLGSERVQYNQELNASLRRFCMDCLFAGITRCDTMEEFSPQFFTGMAMTVRSMIRPASFFEHLEKTWLFFVILAASCVLGFSILRHTAQWLFSTRSTFY